MQVLKSGEHVLVLKQGDWVLKHQRIASPGRSAMEAAMSRYALHPNLLGGVTSVDFEQSKFVMRMAAGVSLAALSPRSAQQVIRALGEVWAGLRAMHAAGFAHGDVKPDNMVLVGGTGKLIDFGWTVHAGYRGLMGTPLYYPPWEQGLSAQDRDTLAFSRSLAELVAALSERGLLSRSRALRTLLEFGPVRSPSELRRSFARLAPEASLLSASMRRVSAGLASGVPRAALGVLRNEFKDDQAIADMLKLACVSNSQSARIECASAAYLYLVKHRPRERMLEALEELVDWDGLDGALDLLRHLKEGVPLPDLPALSQLVGLLGLLSSASWEEAHGFASKFNVELESADMPRSISRFPGDPHSLDLLELEHVGLDCPLLINRRNDFFYLEGLQDEPRDYGLAYEALKYVHRHGFEYRQINRLCLSCEQGQVRLRVLPAMFETSEYPSALMRLNMMDLVALALPGAEAISAAHAYDLPRLDALFKDKAT